MLKFLKLLSETYYLSFNYRIYIFFLKIASNSDVIMGGCSRAEIDMDASANVTPEFSPTFSSPKKLFVERSIQQSLVGWDWKSTGKSMQ